MTFPPAPPEVDVDDLSERAETTLLMNYDKPDDSLTFQRAVIMSVIIFIQYL